jgi:hypothetical protein
LIRFVPYSVLKEISLGDCPALPDAQHKRLARAFKLRDEIVPKVNALLACTVTRVRQNSSPNLVIHRLPYELIRMMAEMLL